ncbi:MAG TPA: hypothetical protein VMT38_02025 [Terracidiphilus sp.]|nr:hypothetical protein [Terracidiphilus sp.]
MYWIGILALILVLAFARYQKVKRAGLWSTSKFFFTLGFAAVVSFVVIAPILLIDMKSPFFWPAFAAGWVVAAGLFVGYIIKARKWKLPDGRTSLEADREQGTPN